MIDSKRRITFDIETYPSAFIVCGLIDGETWQEYIVSPTVEGFPDVVDCSVIRGWLSSLKNNGWTVTYNGKSFDIRVLSWIANCGKKTLTTNEIADAASKLISDLNAKTGNPKTSPCWNAKYSDISKVREHHFDVLKCYTGEHSLKWWEQARGWSIKESSVPFDQPTMTFDELQESRFYCRHDVKCTDLLYMEKDCQELIEARQWVIDNAPCKIFPDVPNAELAETFCYGDEETTNEVEKAIDLVPWDIFDIPKDFEYQMRQIASHEISSFEWHGITYGAGGAHYAKKGYHKGVKIFDVASLYPHIIKFYIKLKTLAALNRYVSCIDRRLQNKAKKGTPDYSKAADKGLKLVLNTVSGKFGQPGAKAYAPEHRLAMCLIGQILATEAAVKSIQGDWSKLIEINTDSFAVVGDAEIERARAYCDSIPHGFKFEEDSFIESVWKDVNNYFVYKNDSSITQLKEAHGAVGKNLEVNRSETVVTESLAVNLRKDQNAEAELCLLDGQDLKLTAENCLVKWSKSASTKNANIDGEPMKFKYYYFMWVTEDCPDAHRIQFNADKVKDGIISVRHGVVGFGGAEEFKKYEKYIDRDQYLEDLKQQLKVWNRPDMFTPLNSRNVPDNCQTFHEIKQATNGFFNMPDDLF